MYMKAYEKPKLIALSLSGNNMLCDSCDIDIVGDNADPDFKDTYGDFPGTFDDASCAMQVTGYCKLTASSNVVVNS